MADDRILAFDIVRIIAVLMIISLHVGNAVDITALTRDYGIPGLTGQIGEWGVVLMVVLSGAVLEYVYGKKIADKAKTFDYRGFISKRILRIYPGYWFALLLALLLNWTLYTSQGWFEWAKALSGFYVFFTPYYAPPPGSWVGFIDPIGWFIGLIVVLYLMYPMVSRFLKNTGFGGLILVFFFSWFVGVSLPTMMNGGYYWYPIARLFEFSLGIYVVQQGLYPKTVNMSGIVRFLSDLSFPVFLTHFTVLYLLLQAPTAYGFNYLLYAVVVLIMSLLVYAFDIYFKKYFDTRKANDVMVSLYKQISALLKI